MRNKSGREIFYAYFYGASKKEAAPDIQASNKENACT